MPVRTHVSPAKFAGGGLTLRNAMVTFGGLGFLSLAFDRLADNHKSVVKKMAFKFERRLAEHIRKQDLDWPALSKQYFEWKREEGWSTKKWIMSSSVLNTIAAEKIDGGSKDSETWFVGWFFGSGQTATGFDVGQVAEWVDTGTIDEREIPPRPLIEPTLDEMKEEFDEMVIKAVEDAFFGIGRTL